MGLLICQLALERGIITSKQIEDSLKIQQELKAAKNDRLIGQIMLEQNWISNQQLLMLLDEQFTLKQKKKTSIKELTKILVRPL
jgi:hypothetical protein